MVIVFPVATSTGEPFPSTRSDPSFDVTTIAPFSMATSPRVLNPGAGAIDTLFAFTLTSALPSGWYTETLPSPSSTVTPLPSRKNRASVSRPNTSRLPLASAITVAPSLTLRLSPLKITELGRSGCPPNVAFILPATDPTTAEPANAGIDASPRRRTNNKARDVRPFPLILIASLLIRGNPELPAVEITETPPSEIARLVYVTPNRRVKRFFVKILSSFHQDASDSSHQGGGN